MPCREERTPNADQWPYQGSDFLITICLYVRIVEAHPYVLTKRVVRIVGGERSLGRADQESKRKVLMLMRKEDFRKEIHRFAEAVVPR